MARTQPKAPAGVQALVVVAILAGTAAFGGCSIGTRKALAGLWVGPACVDACRAANGATFDDVDYHLSKHDNQSYCVCSGNVRLPSSKANVAAAVSVLLPLGATILGTVLVVTMLARRAKRRDPGALP